MMSHVGRGRDSGVGAPRADEPRLRDPRAKPTLLVPLVAMPAFVMLFGGGVLYALSFLSGALAPPMELASPVSLADARRVSDGAYVEARGSFESTGEGLTFSEARSVHVIIDGDEAPPLSPYSWKGRICDARGFSRCVFPRRAARELSAARESGAAPVRLFLLGETPESAVRRALAGFLFALAVLGAYVVTVVVSRRRRKGPARVTEELIGTSTLPVDEVRSAIQSLSGRHGFLIVEDERDRLVFLQGRSESAARARGIRTAESFPRRAFVTWQSSLREPLRVRVRVEEDYVWWPFTSSARAVRLAREAVALTIADLERVLGIRRS
jgi:hypothetical protein